MKTKTKKIINIMLSIIVVSTIIFGNNMFAYAVVSVDTINSAAPTRFAGIPNIDLGQNTVTNCSGISIGQKANKLFVVKSCANETWGVLYYFPDMNNHSKYFIYRIRNVGHANAMAIDSNYIYITAWASNNSNNDNGNEIIRIPKEYIYNNAKSKYGDKISNIPIIDEKPYGNSKGYNRLDAVIKKLDGTYSDYTGDIRSIAYYSSNTFIINYSTLNNETSNRVFTKARIQTIEGTKKFVVGRSTDDVFIIKKNWSTTEPVYQDIGYNSANGFFLPIWYGKQTSNNNYQNPNKTVIAWADIDHPNANNSDTETINNKKYTRIYPDKIVVNVDNLKYKNAKIYEKFEIESIAFDKNNQMFASVNVENTTAYNNLGVSTYKGDGIYKIKNNNGNNFLL